MDNFAYTLFFAGYLVAVTILAIMLLRFAQGLTWGFATVSESTIAVDIIPVSKRGEGIGYFALSAIFWVNALVCAAGLVFFRIFVLPYYEKWQRG